TRYVLLVFSSRRRHTILVSDWSSDVCSSDLHTQFHCNNFLDTVDRFVEARVDRETNTISYGGEQTAVRRYPISIEWPLTSKTMQIGRASCREKWRSWGWPTAEKKR